MVRSLLLILTLAWQATFSEKKKAEEKKLLRLVQVREQSKQAARNVLQAVREEKRRQIEKIANQTESLDNCARKKAKESAQIKYSECLMEIGGSHREAKKQNYLLQKHQDKLQTQLKKADLRGKEAYSVLKEESKGSRHKLELTESKRQNLLRVEKSRSKAIAALPLRIPDPVDKLFKLNSVLTVPPQRIPIPADEWFSSNSGKEKKRHKQYLTPKPNKMIEPHQRRNEEVIVNKTRGTLMDASEAFDHLDEFENKENFDLPDSVTKKRRRRSSFTPEVKFRFFNGKTKRKSGNFKQVMPQRVRVQKEPSSKYLKKNTSPSPYSFKVERSSCTFKDPNAFDKAHQLNEAMHQIDQVQKIKKKMFTKNAGERHKVALKELRAQKNIGELIEEMEKIELQTRLRNKKEYSQAETFVNKYDNVQIIMEERIENAMEDKGEICNTKQMKGLLNEKTPSLFGSQESVKKRAYLPPFQQSPPVNVVKKSTTNPINTLPSATTSAHRLGDFSYPASLPNTSTPEEPKIQFEASMKHFFKDCKSTMGKRLDSPIIVEKNVLDWMPKKVDEVESSADDTNSSQEIIRAFLSKRGLYPTNSTSPCSTSMNVTPNSLKRRETPLEGKKFFSEPILPSPPPPKTDDTLSESSLPLTFPELESNSKAIAEATKELELSEMRYKICQKEQEKIEEEQSLLISQLLNLRKSKDPKIEVDKLETELRTQMELRLTSQESQKEKIPVFKVNNPCARDQCQQGGHRNRPPVMYRRGMDINPRELSTIYESDFPSFCQSSTNSPCSEKPLTKFSKETTSYSPRKTEKLSTAKLGINPEIRNSILTNGNADSFHYRDDSWNLLLGSNDRGITDQSTITLVETDMASCLSPKEQKNFSPLTDWKGYKSSSGGSPFQSPASISDSLLSFQMHEMSACLSDRDTPK